MSAKNKTIFICLHNTAYFTHTVQLTSSLSLTISTNATYNSLKLTHGNRELSNLNQWRTSRRGENLAISRGDGEQEREAKRARIEAPPEARGVLTEADAAFPKISVIGNAAR